MIDQNSKRTNINQSYIFLSSFKAVNYGAYDQKHVLNLYPINHIVITYFSAK